MDIDPTVEEEEVVEAIRSCLQEDPSSGVEVSLTRKHFSGTKKAFVRLEEAPAQILFKANLIKIGWVFCRVHRKMEINRCYRCIGFGHMAANCREPDRSRCCWRCGDTAVIPLHRTRGETPG